MLVCEDDGRIVGFACFETARPPHFGHSGELYAIYFLPNAIGQGLSRSTLAKLATSLTRLGHTDLLLWVMEENAHARRLYERMGGVEIANSRHSFEIVGRTIFESAIGFRPLPVGCANR